MFGPQAGLHDPGRHAADLRNSRYGKKRLAAQSTGQLIVEARFKVPRQCGQSGARGREAGDGPARPNSQYKGLTRWSSGTRRWPLRESVAPWPWASTTTLEHVEEFDNSNEGAAQVLAFYEWLGSC